MEKHLGKVLTLCSLLIFVASLETKFEGRIIGGTNASNQHDFTVRIISAISAGSPFGYLSTGVAITLNHVVTVGQAIHGFGIWYIGHGSVHVSDHQESISTNATAHPNYNSTFLLNNIGVIQVSDNIATTIPIGPHSSPSSVFGYGVVNNVLANTLQQAILFSFHNTTLCIPPFNEFVLASDNICSATLPVALTNGDQGGPVINVQATEVSAIVSFWNTDGTIVILVNLVDHIDFISNLIYA